MRRVDTFIHQDELADVEMSPLPYFLQNLHEPVVVIGAGGESHARTRREPSAVMFPRCCASTVHFFINFVIDSALRYV